MSKNLSSVISFLDAVRQKTRPFLHKDVGFFLPSAEHHISYRSSFKILTLALFKQNTAANRWELARVLLNERDLIKRKNNVPENEITTEYVLRSVIRENVSDYNAQCKKLGLIPGINSTPQPKVTNVFDLASKRYVPVDQIIRIRHRDAIGVSSLQDGQVYR